MEKKWQNQASCGHPLPWSKGQNTQAFYQDMEATLGEDAPSYSMVKKWAGKIKRGRKSLEDNPRPGRPHNAQFCQFFHFQGLEG